MQDFGKAKPPPGAFFDTDFVTIDSVLALAVLHGLQTRNVCRFAIVTMSRPNLAVAGFIDSVERFYRGPAGNFAQVPPVGMITHGAAGETSPAFTVPFQRKKPDGTPVYKNEVKTVIQTGDPNTLLRNYLEAQYDQNAFVVLGGPATNLAAALDFSGMKELIAAKVRFLVVAGGAFPDGAFPDRSGERNIKADIPAARKVFANWPRPIVAAGSEIGSALEFPGANADPSFAPDNPIADAYRAYQPMPYSTPTQDMAAALYAARPNERHFKLSGPGTISVHDDGRTSFMASDKGTHQYLVFDPAQKEKILAAYVELVSAKPAPRRRPPPPAPPAVAAPAAVKDKTPPKEQL